MTCICGHHEAVHHAMCGAPEGCDCTKFRKPAPEPTPFVDETKAVQDAMWLAGSEADTAERNLARAYLALRSSPAGGEAVAWGLRHPRGHMADSVYPTREKAEQHGDGFDEDWEEEIVYDVIPLYTHPATSAEVTEAMVTAGINALDDVSGDKGLSMWRRERVRAILTAVRAEEQARHDCQQWRAEGMGCAECNHTARAIREYWDDPIRRERDALLAALAEAQEDKERLDWFDRIWKDDDINALDLAWQSSTPGPAGSGRAAIDAAIAATKQGTR